MTRAVPEKPTIIFFGLTVAQHNTSTEERVFMKSLLHFLIVFTLVDLCI